MLNRKIFEQCYFNIDHHFKPVIRKQHSTQGKKKGMQQLTCQISMDHITSFNTN